jgi:D-inositol-3-phosphate glycosyltransferase
VAPTKIRIVVLGYHVPGTGFTRVLTSVFSRLAARYEVHYLGIGHRGAVMDDVFTLYPCNLKGGDAWGISGTKELVAQVRPHVLFVFHDLAFMKGYLEAFAELRSRLALVAHFPLDGCIHQTEAVRPLEHADRVVVYTKGSRDVVLRAAASEGVQLPAVDVIPHGIDTSSFRPLAGSMESQTAHGGRAPARRAVFPQHPELAEGFIVLNANRPNFRKRIDLSIRGFALFSRDKPSNVRLHLHHAVITAEEREKLWGLVRECGMETRVHLTPGPSEGVPSDAGLNEIYNAADVGLNTSMGEGWGLVSFEHASTGAAQIVPRHSACDELWNGRADLIEPVETIEPPYSPLQHRVVSVEGVCASLGRLYGDREYLRSQSILAHRNATGAGRSWDQVAALWDRFFAEAASVSRLGGAA